MADFNKGDLAEAILAAAVGARFKKRFKESDFANQKKPMSINVNSLKPINVADVEEVLSQVVAGGAQYRVADFDKKVRKEANIFDNIKVSVSIPQASMNFLTKRGNWASVNNIFLSAVAKVNQDPDLRSNALKLSINLKEDEIVIRGVGTENQKGTKVDLLVEVTRGGKKVSGATKKISLKYDAPQFGQVVGLEFENFGKIFDPLGLNNYQNFNAMFQEEVMMPFPDILSKRFDSRESIVSSKEVAALKKVAKEVFQSITSQLSTKLNDVAFKEQLAKYCIQKATSNESGVELVKFTTKGAQYTQKFGQSFIDNLKATNFDVTFESGGSDPRIIVHEQGKGTGSASKLIQFRYRTDASASDKAGTKKIVMRSYVESGDLLYKL
jgi:YesN/AraC family two-component response regulator